MSSDATRLWYVWVFDSTSMYSAILKLLLLTERSFPGHALHAKVYTEKGSIHFSAGQLVILFLRRYT